MRSLACTLTAFVVISCTKKHYRAPKVGETFQTQPINLVENPGKTLPKKALEDCSRAHQLVTIMWGGRSLYSKAKDLKKNLHLQFYDGVGDAPFYTVPWEKIISDKIKGNDNFCGKYTSYLMRSEEFNEEIQSSYVNPGVTLICQPEHYLPFHKATKVIGIPEKAIGTPQAKKSSRRAVNWSALRKVPSSDDDPGLCLYNIALYK